jgi:hypothetical protein
MLDTSGISLLIFKISKKGEVNFPLASTPIQDNQAIKLVLKFNITILQHFAKFKQWRKQKK